MDARAATGPYSVAEGRTLRRESVGYYYGQALITTRAGADVVWLLLQYKVLTRTQASLMTGTSPGTIGDTMKNLYRLGYLDKLVIENAPSMYCAGPMMRSKYGLRAEEWQLPDALRLVAANQMAAQFAARKVPFGYEVSQDAAATAYLTLNDRRYVVLAPRLCRNEEEWCRQAIGTFDDARVIVVAATEEQAGSVAEYVSDVGPQVRYAWDAALRDGAEFYKHTPKGFVLEKAY